MVTLIKGHSDFKVKCLTFGLYTQVSNSGPLGPLVLTVGTFNLKKKSLLSEYLRTPKNYQSSKVFTSIYAVPFLH